MKIVLSRKGMTIKELAERVEAYTGKPMSRQNMTQRLGRDNFQEQDMRLIAEILGCNFQLNILEAAPVVHMESVAEAVAEEDAMSREITIGDLVAEEEPVEEVAAEVEVAQERAESKQGKEKDRSGVFHGLKAFRKGKASTQAEQAPATPDKEEIVGDINPYTGKEYQTNSVRTHPTRIGYVQVYDRVEHKWTDMTEWAFLGFQERKKVLLGKDYEPPVYLD